MVEFSKNKWKYSTIALAAILAVGFSFPDAFAAASTDSIMIVVKDIQAKINSSVFGLSAIKTAVDTKASQSSVNTLQTDVTAIKGKTNALPSDIASSENVTDAITEINDNTDERAEEIMDVVGIRHAISVSGELDPVDGEFGRIDLIPNTGSGNVYSGHVTAMFDLLPGAGSLLTLECYVGGSPEFPLRIISTDLSTAHFVNEDFSCNLLTLVVHDIDNSEDGPGLKYYVTSEFVEVEPESG